MIIIGYPGIGKTTYSSRRVQAIDLESSNFRTFDGSKIEHWEEPYVLTAIDLSDHGYDVFISSHKKVREALVACAITRYKGIEYCAIVPSIALKNDWIKRLQDRYDKFKTDKNLAALEYVKNHFEESIADVANDIENTFYIVDHPDDYNVFTFMSKVKESMKNN